MCAFIQVSCACVFEPLHLYCVPQIKLWWGQKSHWCNIKSKISLYQKYFENVYACIEKNYQRMVCVWCWICQYFELHEVCSMSIHTRCRLSARIICAGHQELIIGFFSIVVRASSRMWPFAAKLIRWWSLLGLTQHSEYSLSRGHV